MRSKLVDADRNTYSLVLDRGDELVSCLEAFARENHLRTSQLSGVGAFSYVVLGFFNWEKKDYERIHIGEQVEVLSLVGDIDLIDGKTSLHPHVVVAKADGTTHAGHLLEGYVRPSMEVVIEEVARENQRTGVPLGRAETGPVVANLAH